MQLPDPSSNQDDLIDLAMKKTSEPSENNLTEDETHNENGHDEQHVDHNKNDEDLDNRRKFFRSEFTYPAEFKFFHTNSDHASLRGYLKDISISGACLQFDDRYGRFNISTLIKTNMKITFSIPHGDKVSILAQIKWGKKTDPKSFTIKLGIEFQGLESWQVEIIEKLINMRNKDHNMIWNLLEQYDNNWR